VVPSITTEPNFLMFCFVLYESIFFSFVLGPGFSEEKVESEARKEPSRNLPFLSRLATNGSGVFQDATQNPQLIFFPFWPARKSQELILYTTELYWGLSPQQQQGAAAAAAAAKQVRKMTQSKGKLCHHPPHY